MLRSSATLLSPSQSQHVKNFGGRFDFALPLIGYRIIMPFKHQETIHNDEASMRCIHNKPMPYNLKYNGSFLEGFPELKAEMGNPSGGGISEDNSFHNMSFLPHDGYHRPLHRQDFYVQSTYHPGIQNTEWNHFYAIESHFYPMNHEYSVPAADNRFQYVPVRMLSQSYRPEFQSQDFQYFVVIDFEATCDKENNPYPQEIIEFPSVLVNSMTGQLEGYFQIYVRPTHNQLLSDFCKELTGIQQTQVDKGVLLSEALFLHDKWLEEKGIKQTNFAIVTWSNWDCRVMLESECRLKRIRKPPYFNRWINLKVPFHEVFGGVKCNLKEAVQLAGLVWEGRAHCGLDDAKNTARLLAHLMYRGFRFSITNSLMWPSAERPLTMQQCMERHSGGYTLQPHRMKPQFLPFVQFHPVQVEHNIERRMYCHCGVKSSKQMVQKPGPKQGSFFFGCGNWTATRGALCPYFEWATL